MTMPMIPFGVAPALPESSLATGSQGSQRTNGGRLQVHSGAAWKDYAYLDEVVLLSGAQTIAGTKTFSVAPVVPDSSFGVSKINASGTRDGTTALHGDGTWKVPAGGGSSFYQTLKTNDTTRTQRAALNLIGGSGINVTYADDAANNESEVTFSAPTMVTTDSAQTITAIKTVTSARTILGAQGTATSGSQMWGSSRLRFETSYWNGSAAATENLELYGERDSTVAGGMSLRATGSLVATRFIGQATGATAGGRYVGSTADGPPVSGSFLVGDFVHTLTGRIWTNVIAGTPGVWVETTSVREKRNREAMAHFRAAVASADAAAVDVFFLGDSLTEGWGATSVSKTYVDRIRRALQHRYNPTTINGGKFHPAVSAGSSPTELVYGGTPLFTAPGTPWFGVSGSSVGLDSAGDYVELTFTGTEFAIIYTQGNTGILRLTIDGVDNGTINTFNATVRSGVLVVSASMARGSHTVRVAWDSGSPVYIDGLLAIDGDLSAGVRVWNGGHAGYDSADLVATQAGSIRWLDVMKNTGTTPDLICIAIGGNDISNGITPQQLEVNLAAAIDAARGASAGAALSSFLLYTYHRRGTNTDADWLPYVASIERVAVAKGCAFLDLSEAYDPPLSSGASALYGDTVHFNDAGNAAMAELLTQFLIPSTSSDARVFDSGSRVYSPANPAPGGANIDSDYQVGPNPAVVVSGGTSAVPIASLLPLGSGAKTTCVLTTSGGALDIEIDVQAFGTIATGFITVGVRVDGTDYWSPQSYYINTANERKPMKWKTQVAVAAGEHTVNVVLKNGNTTTYGQDSLDWAGLTVTEVGSVVPASNGVTLDSLQVITGAKTFTAPLVLGADYTSTTPTSPAAGLSLFSRHRARRLLASVGPTGQDTAYQPAIFSNRIARWNAHNGITSSTVDGLSTTTYSSGTAVQNSTTSFYNGMVRQRFSTTTTAGTIGGFRSTSAQWFTSSTANLGGFFFVVRFGLGVVTATNRVFIGLSATTTALASAEPSTYLNMIGLACNSAHTTFRIMHNDGSGTATMIDLGANFPAQTGATYFYEMRLFAPSGGGNVVHYSVTRLNDGLFASGTINTDLPAVGTNLAAHITHSNGTTASAASIDVQSLYIETDN